MRINIQSTAPYGIGGGGESEALALIYEHLLQHHKQNQYSHIGIIQVATIEEEVIFRSAKAIHVNIFYPTDKNFEQNSIKEKNLVRLNIVHEALLRISNFENKLDKGTLSIIKEDIIKKKFIYKLKIRSYIKKTSSGIYEAEISVVPKMYGFQISFSFKINGVELWRAPFYRSINTAYFFHQFFFKAKWRSDLHLVIYNKFDEFEIHFLVEKKEIWLNYKEKINMLSTYNIFAADTQKKIEYIPSEGIIIYAENLTE